MHFPGVVVPVALTTLVPQKRAFFQSTINSSLYRTVNGLFLVLIPVGIKLLSIQKLQNVS